MNKLELDLLSELGKDPLTPNTTLAGRLGISRDQVARLIERLKKEGHLLGVSAQVSYTRLGLEPVACLLHCESNAFPILEKLCLDHPYTRYRIRCFGNGNTLLALFAIPPGSIGMVMDLFETMVDKGKLDGYDLHVPVANLALSETDFRRYDPSKGWVFDWAAWEDNWQRRPSPLSPSLPSILSRMDSSDMRILEQISRDVLRTQSDIARAARVTESKLSRRLVFYGDQQVITGYRILAGPFLTGLATTVLFRCRSDFSVVKRIAAALPKLPFQCTLVPELHGFLLYATLSSLDIPLVTGILKRHCNDVDMFWCDYLSSFRWSLDPYPFQKGEWRSDYDFMVSDVLRSLTEIPSVPIVAEHGKHVSGR